MGTRGEERRWRWWQEALLWAAAFLVMAGAAVYQRLTGPTYPMRVSFEAGGQRHAARLVRSGTSGEEARVEVPRPGEGWTGRLEWRRYPTDDPYAAVTLTVDDGRLVGLLPTQPPAGKVEYRVVLEGPSGAVRLPAAGAGDPVLRYKDAVPALALVPHVVVMFLAMWLGVRTGLGALLGRPDTRRLAWMTLGGLTLGGLVLGPIVQKYAFGAFWTGWPHGQDLTDNKALVTWLAWLVACLVLGLRGGRAGKRGRVAVGLAVLVMLVVYLIPHSLRGSELDYERLREGADPAEAIKTG